MIDALVLVLASENSGRKLLGAAAKNWTQVEKLLEGRGAARS
jgi:hypothetical protein